MQLSNSKTKNEIGFDHVVNNISVGCYSFKH